jgi:glyoxylase-like metal-dependent hydrolase (beta-lactamase superfamily II)
MYADHGLVEPELGELSTSLEIWLPYLYSVVEASRRLRGGERIGIGGQDWEVIHTPGHSYGHVCLWSPDAGVVLSGDHLLPGVTPPVTFERGFDPDPLRSYLDSLQRIAEHDPWRVLPGHGRPFGDCARRIDAIIRSKQRGLAATRDAILSRPRTVTEVADEVFPTAVVRFQRNFAMAETLAHIAYLRGSGLVERRTRPDGIYEWYPTGKDPNP